MAADTAPTRHYRHLVEHRNLTDQQYAEWLRNVVDNFEPAVTTADENTQRGFRAELRIWAAYMGPNSIEIGHQVHFKLCDSDVIHAAEVLAIETVPAAGVYSPEYKIFTCKDATTGWVHRLHSADLRCRR